MRIRRIHPRLARREDSHLRGRILSCPGIIKTFLILFVGLLFVSPHAHADEASMPATHLKALFLYNFAKYVDWPDKTFALPDTSLIIGISGDPELQRDVEKIVEKKSVEGHAIVVRQIKNAAEPGICQILFIKTSYDRMPEVLKKLKGSPILTVGESNDFIADGGMIAFVEKDKKMRLAVNLDAVVAANLHVSSKLLGVADVVKSKQR